VRRPALPCITNRLRLIKGRFQSIQGALPAGGRLHAKIRCITDADANFCRQIPVCIVRQRRSCLCQCFLPLGTAFSLAEIKHHRIQLPPHMHAANQIVVPRAVLTNLQERRLKAFLLFYRKNCHALIIIFDANSQHRSDAECALLIRLPFTFELLDNLRPFLLRIVLSQRLYHIFFQLAQ